MLPSNKWFSFDGAILSLKYNEVKNTLTILDNAKQVHRVNLKTFEITKSVALYQSKQTPYDYYKHSGILYDDKNLFFWPESANCGYFVQMTPTTKPKYQFKHHQAPVSAVDFSEDGEFLISADERGRSILLNLQFGTIENTFPPFPDTITIAKFSPNSLHVSIASFKGVIKTYYTHTLELISYIETGSVVESMDFIDEKEALIILRDGRVLHVDILTGEIKRENQISLNVWPTTLSLSSSKKFAYIGTRESKIFILHVNSLECMCNINLKSGGITTIEHSENFLIVGFSSGDVLTIRYREFEEEFNACVKEDKIQEANEYFKKNIFLMTDIGTKDIYEKWLSVKSTIQLYFSDEMVEEAENLAKPFLFHPKCRYEMEQMETNQSLLCTIKRYIQAKKFDKAYELCEENPSLKESIYYSKLEALWNKLFDQAKRLLSREPVLNRKKAKELLSPFSQVVSKQELFSQVMTNTGVFKRAKSMIANKNFTSYYKLVERYTFLKDDDLYYRVERTCEQLKLKMVNYINQEDFLKALQLGTLLEQFKSGKEFANRKNALINATMSLESELNEKNLIKACKIISKHQLWGSHLPTISRYKESVKRYIEKEEKMIEKGVDIYNELMNFKNDRESLRIKRHLFKKLYLHQIKMAIFKHKEAVNWKNTLTFYLSYFSLDEELLNILKKESLDTILSEIEICLETKKEDFLKEIIVL